MVNQFLASGVPSRGFKRSRSAANGARAARQPLPRQLPGREGRRRPRDAPPASSSTSKARPRASRRTCAGKVRATRRIRWEALTVVGKHAPRVGHHRRLTMLLLGLVYQSSSWHRHAAGVGALSHWFGFDARDWMPVVFVFVTLGQLGCHLRYRRNRLVANAITTKAGIVHLVPRGDRRGSEWPRAQRHRYEKAPSEGPHGVRAGRALILSLRLAGGRCRLDNRLRHTEGRCLSIALAAGLILFVIGFCIFLQSMSHTVD